MSALKNSNQGSCNRILSSVSSTEYPLIFANLEFISLSRSQILYGRGSRIPYCVFPESGMISLVVVTKSGDATQISMVSAEGVVGVPALLGVDRAPYDIEVQSPGTAQRIRTDLLIKAFLHEGPLQAILFRYFHSLISQISQSSACNRFHQLESRLACWLLISHDRIQSQDLRLTHEALSHMLGANRTSVTAAATKLKSAGLIEYSRGTIRLLDLKGLQAASCECYSVFTQEQTFVKNSYLCRPDDRQLADRSGIFISIN
jgi:CRP-like cAMP-binding protein